VPDVTLASIAYRTNLTRTPPFTAQHSTSQHRHRQHTETKRNSPIRLLNAPKRPTRLTGLEQILAPDAVEQDARPRLFDRNVDAAEERVVHVDEGEEDASGVDDGWGMRVR